MKQFSTPVIIKNGEAHTLEKVMLNTTSYNESWIQDLCFYNPQLLPVQEIEPAFEGMVPVCKELSTASGYIDLVFVNKFGFITIAECKLWRNPESRRKVVGQILDYAKDLAKWDYSKFEAECLKARKGKTSSLFEIIQSYYPDTEENIFIDNIQKNLQKGRFLLSIIGDGIRENMEELADYIHRNANLNFTLALIELPVYRNGLEENELIVTPRILVKTVEIERVVFREKVVNELINKDLNNQSIENKSSISENVFYDRLGEAYGKDTSEQLKYFVTDLMNEFNIKPKLGRGNKLSLNLKSADELFNFASIQEDGEVWFYGIVTKTDEAGNRQIGIDYLQILANLLNANIDTKYKEWSWCIKRNGNYLKIDEFLNIKNEWKRIISETLERINQIQEN